METSRSSNLTIGESYWLVNRRDRELRNWGTLLSVIDGEHMFRIEGKGCLQFIHFAESDWAIAPSEIMLNDERRRRRGWA